MNVRHPFEWLVESKQKIAFVILFLLTVFVMVTLQAIGGPLVTEAAPGGIVSYEFAGDLPAAQAIVASWGQREQVHAALSLGFDYLFLVAYASAIGLGCVLVARNLPVKFFSLLGAILAWAQWGAALLDSLENYALIRILLGSGNALWPPVARWCAGPKFLIVALGLVYVLLGAVVVAIGWVRGRGR